MRVLVVQNCAVEGLGLFERYLKDSGIDHEVAHPYRGDALPAHENFDAFVIGGTPLAAYKVHEHAFLRDEWLYFEEVLAARKPTLGVCFGGQLLARLLRGRVYPNPKREIGALEVSLTPHGSRDPLLAGFPETFPVVQWHGDTFDVPEGAVHLAESKACPHQAFRHGKTVALQFHLETTAEDVARWADEYADELEAEGRSRDEVVAGCTAIEEHTRPLAEKLMARFLELCA